ASGSVHGLSLQSGVVLWTFVTGGPVYSSPAADSGFVVLGSTDSMVYCLEAASGRLRWSFKAGGPVCGSPAVAGSHVFIGGSDGVFRALELSSGEVFWEYKGVGGYVEARPLVHGGMVIFGAWDETVYALDEETGRLVWKWDGGRPGILYSAATCWPVGSGEKLFLVAPDRMMTALEVSSGRKIWRTNSYQVRETIGRSADGTRVYIRTMRDSIVALNADAETCSPEWVLDAGFGYDINSAMLVESGGVVMYGTKNGLILGVAGNTGALQWQHRVGVGLVNTLCAVDSHHVVVTDVDGHVTLLTHASSSRYR
ncbi:MAG: PQQ-binding-like beta-propeller repeat protein, partial [Bacteroidetes bacterium]|nr:PQQ-binding-like beta-propeller repeat protein [Bacteroidota bacterium]